MECILCAASSKVFATIKDSHRKEAADYFHCSHCDLRFLDPAQRLSRDEEFARYQTHENDVNDPRYIKFMEPVINRARLMPKGSRILDFGCGSQTVLRHVLEPDGYLVQVYDSFFHPDKSVFREKFDFISAIEVIEHLFHPAEVLKRLHDCLLPNGRLAIMTVMYQLGMDFESWYYRRDPTHVAFFSAATFEWIRAKFGFKTLEILGDRTVELR